MKLGRLSLYFGQIDDEYEVRKIVRISSYPNLHSSRRRFSLEQSLHAFGPLADSKMKVFSKSHLLSIL